MYLYLDKINDKYSFYKCIFIRYIISLHLCDFIQLDTRKRIRSPCRLILINSYALCLSLLFSFPFSFSYLFTIGHSDRSYVSLPRISISSAAVPNFACVSVSDVVCVSTVDSYAGYALCGSARICFRVSERTRHRNVR